MSTKDAYLEKAEAQLEEWISEIDTMKSKADKVDADARLEYYEQIEELRTKQFTAQEKLSELKNAGEDAGEDLRAGVVIARASLGEALKISRFAI